MKRFSIFLFVLLLPFSIQASGWIEQDAGTMQSLRGITESNGSLVAVGNTGNMMRSTDGGSSWSLIDKFSNVWWHDVITEPNGDIAAIGESGAYAKSSDGGETWTPLSVGLSVHLYAIDRTDEYGYIVGIDGEALYYSNSTGAWTSATTNITNTIYAVYDMGDGTAWAGTASGRIMYITNGGVSWTDFGQVTPDNIRGVYFESSSTGWIVGEKGTFKKTTDTGTSWTTVSPDGLSNQDLFDIQAVGDNMVVVGDKIVFTSDDGGDTWQTHDFTDENITFYSAYYGSESELWLAGTDFDVRSSVFRFDGTGPSAPTDLSASEDLPVSLSELTFTWTASSDTESSVSTYYVVLDGEDPIDVGDVTEYVWSGLAVGDHAISVYAVDTADNQGDSTSLSFEILAEGEEEEEESAEESGGSGSDGEIVEAEMGTLITLACTADSEVTDPCRAVYYYATDGYRHAFPNERVFFTWFEDFGSLVEVSSDFMSDLRLGSNVTYHPGTKMVKFQSVPTVYTVGAGGELRAIASEEVATDLYGADWNQQIDDISDAFVGNYFYGEDINSAEDYSVDDAMASVDSLDDNF